MACFDLCLAFFYRIAGFVAQAAMIVLNTNIENDVKWHQIAHNDKVDSYAQGQVAGLWFRKQKILLHDCEAVAIGFK